MVIFTNIIEKIPIWCYTFIKVRGSSMVNDLIGKHEKLLTEIIKVSIITIMLLFVITLFGVNLVQITIDSELTSFMMKYNLQNIYYLITLILFGYIFIDVTSDNLDRKKLVIGVIILSILAAIVQVLLSSFNIIEYYPWANILILFVGICILNQKIIIKRFLVVSTITLLYQVIALAIKNITFVDTYNELMYDMIMNFDYMLLCIMTYIIYLRNGRTFNWLYSRQRFSFLEKPSEKKKSLKEIRKQFSNQDKVDKFTTIMFSLFNFVWNILTLALVLFMARLNHTLIECMIILLAFTATKKSFGTPFHMKSIIACFIVSNITFYCLNQITLPLGISIVIQIILGVALAYFTSKLVKQQDKSLYRGMSKEELFEMCENLNDREFEIMKDFYVKKMSVVSMGKKYNYSERHLYKIRQEILNKIKI